MASSTVPVPNDSLLAGMPRWARLLITGASVMLGTAFTAGITAATFAAKVDSKLATARFERDSSEKSQAIGELRAWIIEQREQQKSERLDTNARLREICVAVRAGCR
jgi:hypothetical protein